MYEKRFAYIKRNICGIYKITNTINNKVYIGQSTDIRRRWTSHVNILNESNKNNSEKQYALHAAMQKYGPDNFLFEVIEECPVKDLNDRERYWIKYYNSYLNGYNENEGGSIIRGCPAYVEQVVLLLQTTKYSFEEISKITGASIQSIGNINCGRSFKNDTLDYPIRAKTRKVIQYSKEGVELRTFNSLVEAEKETGVPASNIKHVCHHYENGQILAGGFQWRFIEDKDKLISRNSNSKKRVGKFDQNGILIQIFESAAEAARAENVIRDHISRVCRGERKSLHGFLWKYIDEGENHGNR